MRPKEPFSLYNFLQLISQEYFSALHISTLAPSEQLEHIMGHKKGRLEVVLSCMAVLNHLIFSKVNVHCFVRHQQCEGGSPYGVPVDVAVTTSFVNWMFEAQSSDIILYRKENISDYSGICCHWTVPVWVIV